MKWDAWNPTQYDKYKDERSQPFFDLKDLLEPCAHPRVIDLGCGTGELTAVLHRDLHAAETLAMDSSTKMLDKAAAFTVPGLTFAHGDMDDWVAQNEFDIIFSNAALQWSGLAHNVLFQRLRWALKDKGQLAVQMPFTHDYATHSIAHEMSVEDSWCRLLRGIIYDTSKTMLTAEEYATLLFKLGFREQKVFLRLYGHVLDRREDVIEWVKGTLLTHFQSRLTTTEYSTFLEEYQRRLFTALPDDRPFFYPFKRILLWARL